MPMISRALIFILLLLLFLPSWAAPASQGGDPSALLTCKFPLRPASAPTGSEFAQSVSPLDSAGRERAIRAQILKGNLPEFLKKLKPVWLTHLLEDGKRVLATLFVMPDYLAIGSDRDFLRIPMALPTALEIADRFGFILPTRKVVDAISRQSSLRLAPQPMAPGPRMTSTAYYVKHNQKIDEQRRTRPSPPGALVSGHKKDVVLTNRLAQDRGKVAIYGWHRLSGVPIQPLSTVHRADYADYSHGVRLVSDVFFLDGQPRSVHEVLKDPSLAGILSDEGAIPKARKLISPQLTPLASPSEIPRLSAAPPAR